MQIIFQYFNTSLIRPSNLIKFITLIRITFGTHQIVVFTCMLNLHIDLNNDNISKY